MATRLIASWFWRFVLVVAVHTTYPYLRYGCNAPFRTVLVCLTWTGDLDT